jgi:DNA-binding transcriptional ArsR family regulator
VALDPIRSRLLSELREPASAAALAHRVGLPREKVDYHLRTLESHGLVRLAGTKRWGGLTERRLVATASAYVVWPGAMRPVAVDPERAMDRLAASYLIALAARAIREISDLIRRAQEAGKQLATLSVDTVIRFRSPQDRAAFSRELTEAIHGLVAKEHDETAPGGRSHRLVHDWLAERFSMRCRDDKDGASQNRNRGHISAMTRAIAARSRAVPAAAAVARPTVRI